MIKLISVVFTGLTLLFQNAYADPLEFTVHNSESIALSWFDKDAVIRDYYLNALVSQMSCRQNSYACSKMRAEDPTEYTRQELFFLSILVDVMLYERGKYTQSQVIEEIDTVATRYGHAVYFEPPPQDFDNYKLATDYAVAAFKFSEAFINQQIE